MEMDIKDRIKNLRIANCLTQTSLSTLCQIPQISLSAIERGKYKPNPSTLSKLASHFQINANWLETGLGQPFKDLNGTMELNTCRERQSELSAISILSLSNSPFILCEKERCLIAEVSHDCHIIIHLCEPLDRSVFVNIRNCPYLGEVKESIDLRSPYILSRLFAKMSHDKGIIYPQNIKEETTVAPVPQTDAIRNEPPYQPTMDGTSFETTEPLAADTNKAVPPYKKVRERKPAADIQTHAIRNNTSYQPAHQPERESSSFETSAPPVYTNKVMPYRAAKAAEPQEDVQINEERPSRYVGTSERIIGTDSSYAKIVIDSDTLLAKVELYLHNDDKFAYKLIEFLESYKRTRR